MKYIAAYQSFDVVAVIFFSLFSSTHRDPGNTSCPRVTTFTKLILHGGQHCHPRTKKGLNS